jgi:cytochrome P450
MEAQIAIGSLLARFPTLQFADPSRPPEFKVVPGFRGLTDLYVRLA